MFGLVLAGLFVIVGVCAFYAGRETARTDQLHAARLSRHLHPSQSASIVDQPPGEHVRLVHDAPYDWDTDAGTDTGEPHGATDGNGTD